MKNCIKVSVVILILSLVGFVSGYAFADRPAGGIGKWLQEVGAFMGYVRGSLKYQKNMEVIPTGLRFGFDLKPFTEKFGLKPKGMLELIYEPFISTITQPRTNMEMGLGILLRYSYPLTGKLYPYIEAGVGPYYTTLKTHEQSTQFNFVDQGGAGLIYFFKNNMAINIGYRFRHVSNGGIKSPNGGIECHEYLIGFSRYF
jgi:lipid A 3-O-deacylase